MSDAVSQAAKDAKEFFSTRTESEKNTIGPLIEVNGYVLKKDGVEIAYAVQQQTLGELQDEAMEHDKRNRDPGLPSANYGVYAKKFFAHYGKGEDKYYLLAEVQITFETATSKTRNALNKLSPEEQVLLEKHFKKQEAFAKKSSK